MQSLVRTSLELTNQIVDNPTDKNEVSDLMCAFSPHNVVVYSCCYGDVAMVMLLW